MKLSVFTLVMSVIAAGLTSLWFDRGHQEVTSPAESALSAEQDSMSLEARIASLESSLEMEREARQLLQEEVMVLTAALEEAPSARDVVQNESAQVNNLPASETTESSRQSRQRRNTPEGRLERLLDGGLEPNLASWVVKREGELRMEAIQARYEASISDDPSTAYRNIPSVNNQLRQELGDADYERYLQASGRPVNVTVSSVIGSSPAEMVGLRPGDQIVSYDGKRVFMMSDITRETRSGQVGESVAVDIIRDGMPMQLSMPRGPLGVTARRSRRR